MFSVENETGLPHLTFSKAAYYGAIFDVLVVRGTFDFAEGEERMALAEEPDSLVFGDEYVGPVEEQPLAAALKRAGDLLLVKPGTDVVVLGEAEAPEGQPCTEWTASVRVGSLASRARLLGPRRFERQWGRWNLSSPEPIARVPLDYRLAFGGHFIVPGQVLADGETRYLTKGDNPAGCGWLPSEAELSKLTREVRPYFDAQVDERSELSAPQIEHPDHPITRPTQYAPAHGFGPVARWASTRTRYQGTMDAKWREERFPAVPDDFDPRFYQCASSGLIADPPLRGDELIHLDGVLAEGPRSMRLPGLDLVGLIKRAGAEPEAFELTLDTVEIDLERRKVGLVWRECFARKAQVEWSWLGFMPEKDASEERTVAHG